MEFRTKIDWLSLTGKVSKDEQQNIGSLLHEAFQLGNRLFPHITGQAPHFETVPAARFYALSLVDRASGVRLNVGEDLQRQGYQVVISGKSCDALCDPKTLRETLNIWRMRVTRCDIAIDLIYSELSIEKDADWYRQYATGSSRQWTLINPGKGCTWYVGSRSSERFVRVYDKGAEQGVPVDWIRVEMEAKEGEAQHLLETYLYDYTLAIAEIRDFFKLDNASCAVFNILNNIALNAVAQRQKKPRVIGDREKWLRGQVLASFQKLCMEDPEVAGSVLDDFTESYIAARVLLDLGYK